MQDKQLLSQANSRQKESTKKFKQLEWDYQVLQSRCEQLQAERDEIFSKFVSSVHDVQQKCGLQSMLLQRKVQVLGEKLEKKEAQLGTGEVQGGVHSSAEKVLESKNNLIKSLRYDLGKILKAHNDVIKAYEEKMAEYGIPLEEMGLTHYISRCMI